MVVAKHVMAIDLDSAPEVDRLLTFTLERGHNDSLGPAAFLPESYGA